MNGIFSPYVIFGTIALMTLYVIIIIIPKKKLCHYCSTRKTKKKDINDQPRCDDCYHQQLFEKAILDNPILFCPRDGTTMEIKLAKDTNNTIVHECPTCHHILSNKTFFNEATLGLELRSQLE